MDTHRINQVDLVSGAAPQIGTTPDSVNAVGYNTLDDYIYGWDVTTQHLVRVNGDGTLVDLGAPAGTSAGGYNVGDFDGAGHLWLTTSAGAAGTPWAEIDLAPGSSTYGQVIASGGTPDAVPAPLVTPGSDWSWIGGNLYAVGYSAGRAQAYLTEFDPSTREWGIVGTVPVPATQGVGATFTDGTYLYASENGSGFIYRIDPTDGTTIKIANGPISSGNDGARCASAPIPTITVTKDVAGRVDLADQFTVGLDSAAGDVLTTATTQGADVTASTTNWPVSQGATYTVTDAMADGSPSALTDYTATIVCRDSGGSVIPVGGDVGAWTVEAGSTSIICTVTNTALPKLSIVKTSDATSATRMGDTVHYTVTVTNTSQADFAADDPAEVIDDLTGVLDDGTFKDNSLTVTGSDVDATYSQQDAQIHWSGPLQAGEHITLEYDVVLNKAGDQDVQNVAFQPPPCDGGDCEPPTPPSPPDCAANNGYDPDTGLACDGVDVKLPKLTVTKSSDDLATAQIGGTVHYSITATNTGKAPFTTDDPATMVDDLSKLLDNATYGQDAAVTDQPDAGPGTIAYDTDRKQITWTGALGINDSVTVTYSVTVTGSDELENTVFEWPTCDADDAADCPTPTPPPVCTDGVDPVTGLSCDGIEGGVPELEITKSAPDLAHARIGDTITWTVTATNVGTRDYTDAAPAAIVDDLSGVLDDATFDESSLTTDGSPDDAVYVDGPHPQIGWAGPLAQNDTVTITYSAVLTGAGDGHVDNVVWQQRPDEPLCEIGECQPPDSSDCAATGINPDTGLPCVDVDQPLPRPELSKTSTPARAHIGDTVTYTVTFTNRGPGDYTTDRPARVADDLSGVLDDATFDGTVSVQGSDIEASYDPAASPPQIVWTGPLAAGDSVILTYQVVFTGAGDLQVTNVAYVPPAPPLCPADAHGDCPPPPPPIPPDSSDCAGGVDTVTGLPCVPVTQIMPKLDVTKTSPDLAGARIGDEVTYTITAKSVGARGFTADDPALVIDDLSGVLDDATFDGTVTTQGSDIDANYVASPRPRITWTGPLAVGDTVTLTYTVRLTGEGDLSVDNVAFVPPSPPACDAADAVDAVDAADADGADDGADGAADCPPYEPPTPTCASDRDVNPATGLPCVLVHRDLPKLEITKTSPNLATASIGDDVTFVVTATNVGKRAFGNNDPALVIDDLTGVLDDATFDGTVTVDGSKVKASYDQSRITWSGPLAVGDTVTLTYRVHLTGHGDLQVTNVAFVPPPPPACDESDAADCPPYDPPTPPAPVCASNNNTDPATGLPCVPLSQDLRQLRIVKSSDAAGVVRNGDIVTYSVTATNLGPGDYTADLPATVVDDLTGALDDATYNGDAAADVDGELGYAKGQLSWVGALPAGQSVTITYTVTVTGQGDLDLVNVAFVPPPLDAGCAGTGTCPTPKVKDCAAGVDAVTGQPCAMTEMPLPALYVTKKASSDSPTAGDTVRFTVTMTNTGNVAFTTSDPAVLTDNLASVLDDAAYNDDARADVDGDLAYADRTLTWSGALAVGATVTVTYTVTVNDTKTGDDTLNNVASIPDDITPRYPGGVCPDGAQSCDPPSPQAVTVASVSRSVVVPPTGSLPNTGNNTVGQLQIAALLLLFGIGLAVIGRRRGHRRA